MRTKLILLATVGVACVSIPAMAQTGDQVGLDTKLNLLISSIETLTARIDALEAKTAK